MRAEPLGKRNAFRTASDRRRQLCFCVSGGSRDAFGFFVGAASAAMLSALCRSGFSRDYFGDRTAEHRGGSRSLQTSRQLERAASLDCVFVGAAEAAMLSALCRSGFSRDYFGGHTAEHRGFRRSHRAIADTGFTNAAGRLGGLVRGGKDPHPRRPRWTLAAVARATISTVTPTRPRIGTGWASTDPPITVTGTTPRVSSTSWLKKLL